MDCFFSILRTGEGCFLLNEFVFTNETMQEWIVIFLCLGSLIIFGGKNVI